MISDLIQLIAPGESISIKLDALKDGRVRATVVPKLGDEPPKATELQKKHRKLLATPLMLVDLPATLGGNLVDLCAGASAVFDDARAQIANQVQGLQKAAAEINAPAVAPAKGSPKPHQKPLRPTAADKDGIKPKTGENTGAPIGKDEEE